MPPRLSDQVRAKLAQFAAAGIPLDDLHWWLVENVIAAQADVDDPAVRAALGKTMLYIYEYQFGHRTQEDIRRYVADLLAPATIEIGSPERVRAGTSVATAIQLGSRLSFGISSAAASGLGAARQPGPPSTITLAA